MSINEIEEVIREHLKQSGIDVQSLLMEMIAHGYIAIDLEGLAHGSVTKVHGSTRSDKD